MEKNEVKSIENKKDLTKLYKEDDSLMKRLWLFQCQDIDIAKSKKAHQYKYAPLDEIMKSIKPYLNICGIGIAHSITIEDKEQIIATIPNKKDRHYLNTFLFNVDDSSQKNTCRTLIDEDIKLGSMNKLMVLGASLTYLRRYHVTTLLCLTTEEDTDGGSSSNNGKSSTVKNSNTVDYIAVFTKQLESDKTIEQITKILNSYKAKMTKEQYEAISNLINLKFNKNKDEK